MGMFVYSTPPFVKVVFHLKLNRFKKHISFVSNVYMSYKLDSDMFGKIDKHPIQVILRLTLTTECHIDDYSSDSNRRGPPSIDFREMFPPPEAYSHPPSIEIREVENTKDAKKTGGFLETFQIYNK